MMYPPLHKILRCRICFLMKQNPAKQDSPPAAGRASDILPFRCSAILRSVFIVWKRSFLYDKKNVPWHILAPKRGCFGNHLPLRRVRILVARFYFIGRIFL